jgi:hypothetical protein
MAEFGWWRFPFNAILSVYILPAALLMIQMIKHSDAQAPNVRPRIAQNCSVVAGLDRFAGYLGAWFSAVGFRSKWLAKLNQK